jgi:hypothetical protein
MCLRDIILSPFDYARESPTTYLPWLEPPFLAPSSQDNLHTPRDLRTAREVADFLKTRFRPSTYSSKNSKEMRWVIVCLTTDPSEDSAPKYADWEACASLFVAVDILTHLDGIRHSGFEGQTSSIARGLLV